MDNCVETKLGRFELVRELGQGIGTTVFSAWDPEIQRPVVIKVLGETTLSPEQLSRRIQSVGNLLHPGIVKIFDLGCTQPAGTPYIVMEHVDGESLEVLVARGKLSQPQALALTLELLDAISYAHGCGVHHHNLKPSNLIVTPEGQLKVTDFLRTRSGNATAFMAPEQLKGTGDERSDLFSVGVILYLMVSGYRPFQGNTDATIGFKLIHQHPVPVAAMDLELSPELDNVIGRFLAKNPAERYQTADEAKLDIVKIKDREHAESVPTGLKEVSDLAPTLFNMSGGRRNVGVKAGQPEQLPRAEMRTANSRLWTATSLLAAAVVGIGIFPMVNPLLKPIPAPPPLAAHLSVPNFATETKSASVKSERLRLVRATASERDAASPAKAGPHLVAVPVELRQPFEECLMSIWVDERPAYHNLIRQEKKKRFWRLGTSTAEYLTMVEMPTGKHAVRVEIRAVRDGYDEQAKLSATFSETNRQKLRITCLKSRHPLQIDMN
jgi:serine/threonine-protein kinase